MPKFSYKAINQKGRPVRGVINAANESELFARLTEAQLSLLDCKEMNEKASKLQALVQGTAIVRAEFGL